MAERGPGGREVGRVSLRVLPDTSNFLPSLKKYAERVERTVSVRLGTSIDSSGLERDAARISERVERTVPTIRVPATPVSDGFARDLQEQVRVAAKSIQANIPLTADGERFRRQVAVQVAQLEAEIQRLDIEVPLDVESAAKAKAELRAKVLELQAFADLHAVEIPISTGAAAGGSLSSLGGPAIAALAGVAAILSGGVIASLPALIASIAAPVAAIALGFEGIKAAAMIARPAFDAMRQALSGSFLTALAPVFQTLSEVLPKITPQFQAIAVALSGAFATVVTQLASPDGIAALQGVLQGVADAITVLTPVLGPMTQLFLDLAQTGMAAFVQAAPALSDALTMVVNMFSSLNDSGVLGRAIEGFAELVVGFTLMVGATAYVLAALGSIIDVIVDLGVNAVVISTRVVRAFVGISSGIAGAIDSAVQTIRSLPARVVSALGNLSAMLFGSGASLIQGLIDGIVSKLGPVGTAVETIAQAIKDHFPGSPVKTGPLTSWNGGGAGKRLGDMLASGLDASRGAVQSASNNLASAVNIPSLEGVAAAGAGAVGGPTYQFNGPIQASDPMELDRKLKERARFASLTGGNR